MVLSNMLNPCGVEKSRPIMPMSTSAVLGSVPAREGGRVSMLTRGSSASVVLGRDGEGSGGEGLDSHSAKGSGEGASSMRSERGVVDMLVVRMMMREDEVEWIAVGCLL